MSEEEMGVPLPLDDELAADPGPWLSGKVALVAGGGLSGPEGGIGFAFAWCAARSGATVAVLDRDLAAARRTSDAIRASGGVAEVFVVDLTDDLSVQRAVQEVHERFGRIDVVADTVGGGGGMGIFDATVDEFETAVALNLTSAWLLMRHVQSIMTPGGSIVVMSSGAAERRGPGSPYAIAKSALEKLTVGAAGALAPRGIRVNCIRVGMIWGAFAARGLSEEQRELRRASVAMKTEGTIWDVASAAFFLSTAQARWITGQVLAVDGGGFAPRDMGQAGSGKLPAEA